MRRRDLTGDENRRAAFIELHGGDALGFENLGGAALHLCTGQLWITQ
jgi:hypothetical protein